MAKYKQDVESIKSSNAELKSELREVYNKLTAIELLIAERKGAFGVWQALILVGCGVLIKTLVDYLPYFIK